MKTPLLCALAASLLAAGCVAVGSNPALSAPMKSAARAESPALTGSRIPRSYRHNSQGARVIEFTPEAHQDIFRNSTSAAPMMGN